MNPIALATSSTELKHRFRKASDGSVIDLPPGSLPADPAHLFERLDGDAVPDVVVLDTDSADTTSILALAALFDEQCPGVAVVLVSDHEEEIGLAALRAGVRDILSPEAAVPEIRETLDRARRSARAHTGDETHDAVQRGRVISVVSPKGGTGKTTVATNLAVGLAQSAPNSTVLVDLDTQFGDVASALDLSPEYTLVDAVHGPAASDAMVLKTFLTQHATGLSVVSGAETPAAADSMTAETTGQLLRTLASEFRYVVVDTAPGLPEQTLTAMDESSDLVLVTSMDVPGIRGMRKELEVLDALGIVPGNRHLVVNFADSRGGISRADVVATLGRDVDLFLPVSKRATPSVNQGIPLLQGGTRDPLTKQLRLLVERFVPSRKHSASKSPKVKKAPSPEASKRSKTSKATKSAKSMGRHRADRGNDA